MNATDNRTHECNPLGLYSPEEPPMPVAMLWVGLVHYYGVIVFGTLGNALVLWCVATCTQTRQPVKVLLFSVFLPVLVICLAMIPMVGEVLIAHLTCDPYRISKTTLIITRVMYFILSLIEVTSIAAIAMVRTAAVWAPHKAMLGIRGAVVLVLVTCTYAILTSLGLRKLTSMGLEVDQHTVTPVSILFFITITLPALITAASYILMIFVIQRNKRRLATFQQPERMTTTMDQATRAILAVFICNLVFGLPHSIYHLMGKQPFYMSVIIHVIFSTHYVVDPLLYMWFNSGCREKVLSSIRKVTQFMSSSSITTSVLQTRSIASCDHQKQQKSSTHTYRKTAASNLY